MLIIRISFELAKQVKALGFHWEHFMTNNNNETVIDNKNAIILPGLKSIKRRGVETERNHCYNSDGKYITPKYYNPKNEHYPCPTQAELSKWIRDTYNIHITPIPNYNVNGCIYFCIITTYEKGEFKQTYIEDETFGVKVAFHKIFNTYEEALETGLIYVVNNNINTKKI